MKFIITTETEETTGSCTGCALEYLESCNEFCPGEKDILVITKIEPMDAIDKHLQFSGPTFPPVE